MSLCTPTDCFPITHRLWLNFFDCPVPSTPLFFDHEILVSPILVRNPLWNIPRHGNKSSNNWRFLNNIQTESHQIDPLDGFPLRGSLVRNCSVNLLCRPPTRGHRSPGHHNRCVPTVQSDCVPLGSHRGESLLIRCHGRDVDLGDCNRRPARVF